MQFDADFERSEAATDHWRPRSNFRLLAVGDEEPSWPGLALELDALGCTEPRFCWEPTVREAVARLREETFDVIVLVADESDRPSHARALLTAAPDESLVVCSRHASERLWIDAARFGCEPFVASDPWRSRGLLPTIGRAVERRELLREHDRLASERVRRLDRERREAELVLQQQQRILAGLTAGIQVAQPETAEDEGDKLAASPRSKLHDEIRRHYHELLRTFVIMGSGRMHGEIAAFAEMLATADIGPREALELHLERVDDLVRGLGNRSTRHVLDRADLLALELVVHLGEHLHRGTTQHAAPTANAPSPPGESEPSVHAHFPSGISS